jgi:hypothetical protein
MKTNRGVLTVLGRAARVLMAVTAAAIMIWAIVYRFILGFTPLWLDVTTLVATALALLILLALGRGGKFDYSIRVNTPSSASEHKQ